MFECPTELCLVLVRTQLFDDDDMPEVAALQDAITVTALGDRPPMPKPVPTVDVRRPLDIGFLRALDWMLQFMPTLPEDRRQRAELTALGIENAFAATDPGRPDVTARSRRGWRRG